MKPINMWEVLLSDKALGPVFKSILDTTDRLEQEAAAYRKRFEDVIEENEESEDALFQRSGNYPSYFVSKKSYAAECKRKTKRTLKKFKERFNLELDILQKQHSSALGGVQIERCFMIGVRVPKNFKDPLTPQQRSRVLYLLANPIN